MRVIEAKSCNDAFIQASWLLSEEPDFTVAPRGQKTKEITNAVIIIANPYDRLVQHSSRSLSLKYLAGEFLWYERGSNRLSEISHYSSFWNKCSDDGETLRSSYGMRLYKGNENIDQWKNVEQELINDPSSRRAMLQILEPRDLNDGLKDVPCTIGLQFLIRGNRLHLTTWMRSNDLFLGFCYDAAVFTLWQEKMLRSLQKKMHGLKMGNYTHIATSLHIYENNFEVIEEIVRKPNDLVDNELFEMPYILDNESISQVQRFENALRTKGHEKIALEQFEDPFADWLARCLYAG